MEKEKILTSDPSSGCTYRTLILSPSNNYRREHFHDEIELVCVWEGEVLCMVDGESIVLPQGKIMVINSRVIHRLMYSASESRLTYIQINIESITTSLLPDYALLACILNQDTKSYSIFTHDSPMGHLFMSIFSELETRDHLYDVAVKGCVYQLVSLMCRAGMINLNTDLVHQKEFKKILPALFYAKENFAQKITLDRICRDLNVDKYHFCKRFKKMTGLSFFDYLGHLRLQNAEELLISTDKSITEIGMECGFASLQYFNRFFTEHKGYSPTVYRRMMGEEQQIQKTPI